MKIESIIQRVGGSAVALGTTVYRFLPDAAFAGAHVAEVTDTADIQRFLSITEGYRIAVEAEAADPAPAAELVDGPSINVPDTGPVAETPAADTPPADEPAPLPPVPALDADAIDAMERAELDRLFEAREGRKPSPKTKDDTLREKLKELARADQAT